MMYFKSITAILLTIVFSCQVFGHDDHEHSENWKTLFDGTNTDSWRGYNKQELPAGWVIEDGSLYRKAGGGDIITKDKFADFEFVFEWRIGAGGNSGVMYRVSEGDGAPYMTGPEFQILDNEKHRDGSNELTSAGALYGLYKTDKTATKPVGEWNSSRILLDGTKIQHWLNGQKLVDCDMASDDWSKRLAESKFSGWKKFATNRDGHLALQDHGDNVWFRNMKIRRLGHTADDEHGADHDDHDHEHDHRAHHDLDGPEGTHHHSKDD